MGPALQVHTPPKIPDYGTNTDTTSRRVDSCDRLQARISPFSESYTCKSRWILGISALPVSLSRTPL